MIQWLRLCAPNAKGTSLITGQGTKTPHATQHNQKKKSQRKLLSNSVYNELVAMHLTVLFANFFFFFYHKLALFLAVIFQGNC